MKQPLLAVAEAQERLLALAEPLPLMQLPVEQALGRWLAEPLTAARTQPAADLSAMDGYALAAGDTAGPWQVIGESAAGHPFGGRVRTGEAVRVSTGALLPEGAATVLLQEDTARDGARLSLTGEAPGEGRHIRRAGFDFKADDILLERGTRITPAVLALAIAAGHTNLSVHRLPAIAIIDSGDELAADPAGCAVHQIPASNGAMLAAMVAGLTSGTARLGPVPDRREALTEALDRASGADVIVTSGGASVGDHDLVRPALEEWGARIDFWKVAMKPGKPIMVARKGRQLILGLPGNPVSSFVTAHLFLLPLLRALAGAAQRLPLQAITTAGQELKPGGSRAEFLRGCWDGNHVTPLVEQDSSALGALAKSNALIVRAVDAAPVAAGGMIPIILLENGGIA